jgi:nitrate reductase NapE component
LEQHEVWTSEEIRKEEVRGVFAIGAMAALIALRYTPVAQEPIETPGLLEAMLRWFGFGLPQIATLTLANLADATLPYWLGYVLIACVSLMDDFIPRNRFIHMLAYGAKLLSRWTYALAILATCTYGILILWKTAVFGFVVWMVVFAVLLGIIAFLRLRRRLKH